jgi:hypothetical protein
MNASKALCRTLGKQLKFAGPWVRGHLPATTVSGYASAAFSHLSHTPALHRPKLEKPGRHMEFATEVNYVNPDLYSEKGVLKKCRSS